MFPLVNCNVIFNAFNKLFDSQDSTREPMKYNICLMDDGMVERLHGQASFLYLYITTAMRESDGMQIIDGTVITTRFSGELTLSHATGRMCLYVTCPIKLENTKTPVKKLVI